MGIRSKTFAIGALLLAAGLVLGTSASAHIVYNDPTSDDCAAIETDYVHMCHYCVCGETADTDSSSMSGGVSGFVLI